MLIGVEAGRLLGAHRTPPGSSALRESEATATKCPAATEINRTLWDEKSLKRYAKYFEYMLK